MTTGVRSVII